jgi:hypothetical protein
VGVMRAHEHVCVRARICVCAHMCACACVRVEHVVHVCVCEREGGRG